MARVVWSAQSAAFGIVIINTEAVVNNLRFPGQYYDAESGSYYNFYRDYDPELGRYLQSDPLGLSAGINYYVYSSSSAINRFDPHGLDDFGATVNLDLQVGVGTQFQFGFVIDTDDNVSFPGYEPIPFIDSGIIWTKPTMTYGGLAASASAGLFYTPGEVEGDMRFVSMDWHRSGTIGDADGQPFYQVNIVERSFIPNVPGATIGQSSTESLTLRDIITPFAKFEYEVNRFFATMGCQ